MKKHLLVFLLSSLLFSVQGGAQEQSTQETLLKNLKEVTNSLLIELADLQKISKQQTVELENSKKRIASLQSQLTILELQIQKLTSDSTELQTELSKSKDLLTNLQKEYEAKIKDLKWQRNRAILFGIIGVVLVIVI